MQDKALLKSSDELLSSGVKQKYRDKIQGGHTHLTKGDTNLREALKRLQKLNKQIYKKTKAVTC